MNFVSYLFQNKEKSDSPLILSRTGNISYREIFENVLKVCGILENLRKENVVIFSENNPFFISSYLGIMASGNISVPLNTKLTDNELEKVISIIRPAIVFCDTKHIERLKNFNLKLINSGDIDKNSPSKLLDTTDEETAEILFTSGSSGEQKGVMLSHKNLRANTESIIRYLRITEKDIAEQVLPFYYCYGLSVFHSYIKSGAKLVLNNTFLFPETVVKDIKEFKCTSFSGVPSHYEILISKTSFLNESLPSLRYLAQAGGKMNNETIKRVYENKKNSKLFIMYGQTEATARLSYLFPENLPDKIGSIGKGVPGVELRVVNERGNQVKEGEVGEIIARGDNLMIGYLNDSVASKEKIKDGWLYTGDLGTIDKDGFIFINGRADNLIKIAGFRVSTDSIREEIKNIPAVNECAILAEKDDLFGSSVTAFVSLNKNVSETYLFEESGKRLASYMIPKKFVIVEKIPLSESGKISKQDIIKLTEKSQEKPSEKIEDFIKRKPCSLSQNEKEKYLLNFLKESLKNNFKNENIKSYYNKIGFSPDKIHSLEEIPYIPASMFKKFNLSTLPESEIMRVLKSSSTTGQTPSAVPIDKITSMRQSSGLITTLSDYLGAKRMPMLVFDIEKSNSNDLELGARGVGIRGFSNFANEIVYVLKEENGKIILDENKIKEFYEKHKEDSVFVFGFTYLIWEVLSSLDVTFPFKNIKVFHGGGWKKLHSQNISKEQFNQAVSKFFSCNSSLIYDFYGMVEQTGVVFIDCEYGYKHVPNFADIIIRDFYSLDSLADKEGLINIINILPNSYPGQSILTEDKGRIIGIDDCKCGRKGKYFVFTSRVQKSEARGCGDTMPNLR